MTRATRKVRIVCVSDTHNAAPGEGYTLPKGDILLHAGDLTNQGTYAELKKAVDWIERADFPIKIVVAGNHDLSLDSGYRFKYEEGWTVQAKDVAKCRELLNASPTITYLEHAAVEVVIPGKNVLVRVFGSPHSPDRGGQNWAFQYTEREAEELWSAVPFDTDILISHTPPAGHCDASKHWLQGGCKGLLSRIQLIKPLLHVCGHCHEGRGGELLRWNTDNSSELARQWEDPGQGNKKQSLFDVTILHPGSEAQCIPQTTAIVNASIMATSWGKGAKRFNKPIVVDIELPVQDGG